MYSPLLIREVAHKIVFVFVSIECYFTILLVYSHYIISLFSTTVLILSNFLSQDLTKQTFMWFFGQHINKASINQWFLQATRQLS